MTHQELDQKLREAGFALIGVPELSGRYEYALFNEARLLLARTTLDGSGTVNMQVGGTTKIVPILHSEFVNNLESFIGSATERLQVSQEDLEVANLIREIRTLILRPEDRLVVTVKEERLPKNHTERVRSLDALRDSVSAWIGEKNSNRVMVLVGDVDFTKIRKEKDGQSN